ncbi:MAG: hypothetical protein R3E13_07290 [Alphaproteobacteria bacterium]
MDILSHTLFILHVNSCGNVKYQQFWRIHGFSLKKLESFRTLSYICSAFVELSQDGSGKGVGGVFRVRSFTGLKNLLVINQKPKEKAK